MDPIEEANKAQRKHRKTLLKKNILEIYELCRNMPVAPDEEIIIPSKTSALEAFKEAILCLYGKSYSAPMIANILNEHQQAFRFTAKEIESIVINIKNLPQRRRRKRKGIDVVASQCPELQPEKVNEADPQNQEQTAVMNHDENISLNDDIENGAKTSETENKKKNSRFSITPDRADL